MCGKNPLEVPILENGDVEKREEAFRGRIGANVCPLAEENTPDQRHALRHIVAIGRIPVDVPAVEIDAECEPVDEVPRVIVVSNRLFERAVQGVVVVDVPELWRVAGLQAEPPEGIGECVARVQSQRDVERVVVHQVLGRDDDAICHVVQVVGAIGVGIRGGDTLLVVREGRSHEILQNVLRALVVD